MTCPQKIRINIFDHCTHFIHLINAFTININTFVTKLIFENIIKVLNICNLSFHEIMAAILSDESQLRQEHVTNTERTELTTFFELD